MKVSRHGDPVSLAGEVGGPNVARWPTLGLSAVTPRDREGNRLVLGGRGQRHPNRGFRTDVPALVGRAPFEIRVHRLRRGIGKQEPPAPAVVLFSELLCFHARDR